jgi:hypothetical protein
VYLKVVALNSLYSTRIHLYSDKIPSIGDLATHIVANADAIDFALQRGSLKVVDLIGKVTVESKAPRFYFSFATKFCSWSNKDSYPIYDSRAALYLTSLAKLDGFEKAFDLRGETWTYKTFRDVVDEFRQRYGFSGVSYKQIDKLLYQLGTLFDSETP